MANAIAYNVFGILGAVCWSIQLLPQIYINYHRHSTQGLQKSMMLLWACAGVPLGVYNIVNDFNVALLIQPQILTVLSLITWGQCYHYDEKWSVAKCTTIVVMVGSIFGGIETALIFALRVGVSNGTSWPVILMGVLSAVLLALGVLRHYYDIYIHRTVRGISFLFVGIDAAGDVFSLISLFFEPRLDVLGVVIYATEFVLWCGVFACGGYYNFLPWLKQSMEKKSVRRMASSRVVREEVVNMDGEDLDRVESSTSVFHTPSSVLSHRSTVRPVLP